MIRTRSLATIMRRAFVGFALFVVLLVAAVSAFAVETPPQALLTHISSHPIVHDKLCNVESLKLKNVECLIMYDEKHDVVWVVLFDDELDITRIIASKGNQEAYVWCRQDICL